VASPAGTPVPAVARHPEISLQSIRNYQNGLPSLKAKPWLTLVVGQDAISTGMSATLWLPSRGRWEHTENLVRQRWLMPPMNVNDLISLALRGLESWEVRNGTRPANTDSTSV
jgi:hypothetical protein